MSAWARHHKIARMATRLKWLLLTFVFLTACSDDVPDSVFPEAEAQTVAMSFVRACIDADIERATAATGVPFRYRTRDWITSAELAKELPRQFATIAREAGAADTCEVWPYARLLRGSWPRAEMLDVASSERRLGALGVDPNGFLVRLVADGGSSVTLRVNPDAAAKLVVSGVLTVP